MEYCDIENETPIESKEDTDENNTPKDLSSPNPCLTIKEMTKEKIFRISYLDNYYLLIISNIIDKYLSLELLYYYFFDIYFFFFIKSNILKI